MVSHKVGGEASSQMVLYRNLSIKMGSGRSTNEDLDIVYLSVGLGSSQMNILLGINLFT